MLKFTSVKDLTDSLNQLEKREKFNENSSHISKDSVHLGESVSTIGREYDSPMYRAALVQLDETASLLNLPSDLHARLRHPKRSFIVSVPTSMDDGTTKIFTGFRVQHNLTLGPCKGGIRYHEDLNLGEVSAMAMWMSWKCGLMKLPFGGAKGGVAVRPWELSTKELENLTRRYTSEIGPFIGPDIDIPASDMGTDDQIMAWMMDTYSMLQGHTVHGSVTSKPILLGGSMGRGEATGRGAAYVFEQACRAWKWDPTEMTAIIQGFGNVGSAAAMMLNDLGVKIIAVEDRMGAVGNERGLDVSALFNHIQESESGVRDFSGGEPLTNNELLSHPCDLLVPAAVGNVITEENVDSLSCQVILECANGPTSPKADEVLMERGIVVLPDILANAGGVTVSYFEWVQDTAHYFWDAEEVDHRLGKVMTRAFDEVRATAEENDVSLRTAALMLGVHRVAEGKRMRGLYP